MTPVMGKGGTAGSGRACVSRHDPGDARRSQHIALWHPPDWMSARVSGFIRTECPAGRYAVRVGFSGNIHHACRAALIEVRKPIRPWCFLHISVSHPHTRPYATAPIARPLATPAQGGHPRVGHDDAHPGRW